jgi:hypothetical protein
MLHPTCHLTSTKFQSNVWPNDVQSPPAFPLTGNNMIEANDQRQVKHKARAQLALQLHDGTQMAYTP